MILLTFQIGAERLGLDVRRVREIIPRVHLQPLAGAPDWLSGVFVYRGTVVPVIDLCHLMLDEPCPALLSSRIILVRQQAGDEQRLLGLLAASVAHLVELTSVPPALPSFAAAGRADLGPVISCGRETLRLVNPDCMLPASARQFLESTVREAPG